MIRSDFIKYTAALAAMFRLNPTLAFEKAEPGFSKKVFGDDFMDGAGTSVYQRKGVNVTGDFALTFIDNL
jgi:hypothetical protein